MNLSRCDEPHESGRNDYTETLDFCRAHNSGWHLVATKRNFSCWSNRRGTQHETIKRSIHNQSIHVKMGARACHTQARERGRVNLCVNLHSLPSSSASYRPLACHCHGNHNHNHNNNNNHNNENTTQIGSLYTSFASVGCTSTV